MRANKNLSYKNTMKNAYDRIQEAMKKNEKDVVRHIKKYGALRYQGLGMSWMKATDRLEEKGQVKYSKKEYGYVLA